MTAHAIDAVSERTQLAGLERFLHDPAVNEVMVHADGEVWIDRHGTNERVASITPDALAGAVERLLAPLGRRVDRLSPIVDARLPNGARVCVVIPPIAVDGTVLAIRRFPAERFTVNDFARAEIAALLGELVAARANIVVSGATSSGKTSLTAALAGLAEPTERLITLEDTIELRIAHPHVVRLECRPATAEGLGAVTIGDLLRAALRLRPDRLVVGEIRGTEAVHLLQAMNTGHDGSIATIHANSAGDALARLASLVLSGEPTWSEVLVGRLIGAAVDIVVHLRRLPGGRREVSEIVELGAGEGTATRSLVDDGRLIAGLARRRRR